jgi:hypothetical protein
VRLGSGSASRGSSRQPPAPIRSFDIATIEQLAQQMYAQDRIAWTASDVLLAHIDEKKAAHEGVVHWITGTRDGHNLVRFIQRANAVRGRV